MFRKRNLRVFLFNMLLKPNTVVPLWCFFRSGFMRFHVLLGRPVLVQIWYQLATPASTQGAVASRPQMAFELQADDILPKPH